jgi:hypothetical protein
LVPEGEVVLVVETVLPDVDELVGVTPVVEAAVSAEEGEPVPTGEREELGDGVPDRLRVAVGEDDGLPVALGDLE